MPLAARTRRLSAASWRDLGLAGLTLVLAVAAALSFPSFATPANAAHVLDDTAILIILALGQMLVIVTRAIDLSVAANLALSGMIAALLGRSYPQLAMPAIVAAAILSGALLGAFNGLLVWKLRVPAIVVTLGTMSVYRGAIFLLSKGTWVNDNEMSSAFLGLVRAELFGLTSLTWLAVALASASFVVLRYTNFGRDIYAVGGNETAAAYAGIDAGWTRFCAFTLCGALAGLCGYLWVARFAVAYTDVALGFELQVIAACLIGGVAIAGGAGGALGVIVGCLFLGVLKNLLPLIGVSPFWQMFVNGVVIIAAALLSGLQQPRKHPIMEPDTR